MKQILIVKPGSIDAAHKKLLTKEGVIIIEHENPDEVRVITSLDGLEGNDILNAAVFALKGAGMSDRAVFAGKILNSLSNPPQ